MEPVPGCSEVPGRGVVVETVVVRGGDGERGQAGVARRGQQLGRPPQHWSRLGQLLTLLCLQTHR